MLRLETPNESHMKMYEDMIQEWSKEDDFHNTSPWALFFWESYEEFLKIIDELNLGEYKWYTPSSVLFLVDEEKIIWWIDIRHNIDAPVLHNFWGHIWYWIRPSERRKWYASKILKMGLQEAKRLGIEKILISHHPENIPSQKVILANWWEYFETRDRDWEIFKKYWIDL